MVLIARLRDLDWWRIAALVIAAAALAVVAFLPVLAVVLGIVSLTVAVLSLRSSR